MAGVWQLIVPSLASYVNLCANPSFETNTTGWTAVSGAISAPLGGTHGNNALLCTASASSGGAYYGSVALAATTYTVGFDIKGPTSAAMRAYIADTSANVIGSAHTFTIASSANWQREYFATTCASADNYRLYVTKDDFDGTDFYLDSISIVATTAELTYFDGDTANCRWSGVAHGSTSISDAQARNVGTIADLQDYNLRVLTMDGVGTPDAAHHVSQYAMMPGAEYKGHKVMPRSILLTSAVYGTSLENLHSKRKALINLLKHDLVANDQPIVLRYTGANSTSPVEITCYLDKEAGTFNQQKVQNIAIRLIAYDPYFYNVNETSSVLTTVDSGTRNYFAAKKDGYWTAITPSAVTDPGSGITVRGMDIVGGYRYKSKIDFGEPIYLQTNNKLYVAGLYLNWDGTAASDYIAYYDFAAETWNAIEAGTNGYVRNVAIDAKGYIYACGEFTQIGDTAANRIAYWDGSNWNAMGTGFGGTAYDVLVGNDGKVYAVGNDSTIGGVAKAAYVAYWDGTAWQKMATGISGVAYALDKDTAGNIYIAGTQTGYVTKWDGAAFTSLAAPSVAWAVKVDQRGNVYAGMAGSEYIKMWNGQSWQSLAGGVTTGSFVYAIDIDADGVVWLGGDFTAAGGLTFNGLACWNGYSWLHPDIYLPGTASVYSIVCRGRDIYIGWNTAGTAYFADYQEVSNTSTARVYPLITINRSGGTTAKLMYLRNETTGATLRFDYDLQDGETVAINFAEGQRSITSSYYGDIYRAILRGSDFADFYLLPGSNYLSALVYTTGSPTMTGRVNWRDRYETIDGTAA